MISWPLDEFKNKDIVFVGAGKGRAMAGIREFLEATAAIKSFSGVDKQPGETPLEFLKEYDSEQTIFIKNEAIPGTEMPVPYLTSLQLFFRLVSLTGATTVGVTGTKGKSTTTALTAHILETAGKAVVLAGNIGVSPLPALLTARPDTIFVLELSSYQLSDLQQSPHISACINLYNDHGDWHGSRDRYWEAKHNIMRFAGPDDVFIYNPGFDIMRQWAEAATCQTIAIDPQAPLDLSQAHLFGDHNRLNALVAREIARQFDVDDATVQVAVNSFETLEHRMQTIGIKNGKTYVDDAIGMTPESTLASLTAISQQIGPVGCLFLGGQDRGYDFTILMQEIAKLNIPNLVMFPETEAKMKAALPQDYKPAIFETRSMDEAVQFADTQAPDGSVVLLSTAAPSYLLWKDFPDKGRHFWAAFAAL